MTLQRLALGLTIGVVGYAGGAIAGEGDALSVAVRAEPVQEVSVEAEAETASCCTLPGRFAIAAAATAVRRVSVEPSPEGRRVLVGGELFAGYRTDTGRQPAVWPIVGPSGYEMTRSWPLGPRGSLEETDHPHHESLWFSHGGVNGHDFWQGGVGEDDTVRPRIVHTGFVTSEAVDGAALITTTNDWNAGGQTVLEDVRHLAFGLVDNTSDSPRYIDFTIRLDASQGAVTFADTKEGTFGVRVPGPLKLDAGQGGAIVNSRGQQGKDAWGRPAEWVDYHGPLAVVEGDGSAPQGGVAILSHPESFRPACRWHVRGYGLFAANPFGAKDFPAGGSPQGEVTLAAGDALTLRYRVVFYAGAAGPEVVARWYDDFAATPLDQFTRGD